MTILYIPVLSLFISILAEGSEDDVGILRTVVVILVSVVFGMMFLMYSCIVIDICGQCIVIGFLNISQQDPTDKKEVLARPHSRIDVFHVFAKTVLTGKR